MGQAGSVHSTADDMNKYMRHIIENKGQLYADLVSRLLQATIMNYCTFEDFYFFKQPGYFMNDIGLPIIQLDHAIA